jgi:hypothetical protein
MPVLSLKFEPLKGTEMKFFVQNFKPALTGSIRSSRSQSSLIISAAAAIFMTGCECNYLVNNAGWKTVSGSDKAFIEPTADPTTGQPICPPGHALERFGDIRGRFYKCRSASDCNVGSKVINNNTFKRVLACARLDGLQLSQSGCVSKESTQ